MYRYVSNDPKNAVPLLNHCIITIEILTPGVIILTS
jgi:hypothetical protein